MDDAIGNVSDDGSFDAMFIVGQVSRRDTPSYWLADDAGLGVQYMMVTSSGDNLIWSS